MSLPKFKYFKVFIILFVLISNSAYADSDFAFAEKLANIYPKLALKYMTDPNGPGKDTSKKAYNKAMSAIYKNLASKAKSQDERRKYLKKSLEYLGKTNPTPLEIANASYKMAMTLKLGLSDYRLSEKDRTSLVEEILPFYNQAGDGYDKIGKNVKEKFTKGMDKILGLGGKAQRKFLKSQEFKSWFKDVYNPYVVSKMRFFECKVERASILPKGDPRKLDGIDKLVEQAGDISYELEAPIPVATITTFAARMYNILAQSGKEPKKNSDMAIEKFKEVLDMEAYARSDKAQLRTIKSKAIAGLLENSLATKTFESGHESFERYLKSIFPKNYKFTIDDFNVMFDGLYINAHLYKKTKDAKYELGIKKASGMVTKAASRYGFWKKKLIDVMIKVAAIKGEKISDPNILFKVARNLQEEKKYKEAIEMYQKGFAVKMNRVLALSLKPKNYRSLAYCAYKSDGQEKIGRDSLLKFFKEYPPSNKKYAKSLKDFYPKNAELLNILAVRVHNKSKDKVDYGIVMDSLDLLEMYNPDKVVFKKVSFLSAEGNFIDSLKLLDQVKTSSNSYDKAMYLKGLYNFKYSKFTKSENEGEHSDSSMQQAKDSKKSFEEFIEFVKTDTSDIIKEKKDIRLIWQKDSQKLLGFVYVSLGEYDNAIKKLTEVLKNYRSKKEDQLHSNMIYVLQSLFLCYIKKEKAVKGVPEKMKFLKLCRTTITEIEDLDLRVFHQYKDPKTKKKGLLSNYYKQLGIMMLNNAAKDKALIEEGGELLGKDNDVKNLSLYLARIMFASKNYESAIKYFSKALDEYKDKGFDSPLTKEDMKAIQGSFVDDSDINFFKKNFRYLAINKKNEKTRDFGRLRRNLKIIIDPKWKPKTENDEEKKVRKKFVKFANKPAWVKLVSSGKLKTMETKLVEFLTYLGIVDDLAICYQKVKSFEKSIKFLDELKVYYPGILSEDIKLANLNFEYAKSLYKNGKGNAKDQPKVLELLNKARDSFIDLKRRLKKEKGSLRYIRNNEKRLLTYILLFKSTKKEDYFKKVITSMSIEFSNQESYGKYTNLFTVLTNMNKMPKDLVALSPEDIRKREKKIRDEAQKAFDLTRLKRLKYQELQLIKRNNSVTVPEFSFVELEFSNLGEDTYKELKKNIESIKNIKEIKVADEDLSLLELTLREKFNKILMEPGLYTRLPKETLAKANATADIKKIDDLVKKVGDKEAFNNNKTISYNRDILKKCFPGLPKKVFEPQK